MLKIMDFLRVTYVFYHKLHKKEMDRFVSYEQ